jgi:hypothetical protein
MTSHHATSHSGPAVRLLSLGAGVQSTTVLLLASARRAPCHIVSATGWLVCVAASGG